MSEQLEDDELDRVMDTLGSVVGTQVRQYRMGLGLTIMDLAERTGLSKAMLSKIENNRTSPSLATLARLSHALEVPVMAFFRGLDEEHDAIVVKSGAGIEIAQTVPREGVMQQLLGMLHGPHQRLEPVLVTFESPQDEFPLYQHGGSELVYVIYGAVEYGYGTSRYVLEAGDTIQFIGAESHGVTQLLQLPVQLLSIKAYGIIDDSRTGQTPDH